MWRIAYQRPWRRSLGGKAINGPGESEFRSSSTRLTHRHASSVARKRRRGVSSRFPAPASSVSLCPKKAVRSFHASSVSLCQQLPRRPPGNKKVYRLQRTRVSPFVQAFATLSFEFYHAKEAARGITSPEAPRSLVGQEHRRGTGGPGFASCLRP